MSVSNEASSGESSGGEELRRAGISRWNMRRRWVVEEVVTNSEREWSDSIADIGRRSEVESE